MNRLRTFGIATLCAGALVGAAASPAGATILLSAAPNLTVDPATAGQTNLPGSLVISNDSTAPHAMTASVELIRFTPSCGAFTSPPCTTPEPGVITVNPTATGAVGSSCAGTNFSFPVTDNATGEISFTPSPGSQPQVPAGSECRINFAYNVVKSPAIDSQPGEPGIQTDQILFVRFSHPSSFDFVEELGSDFTTIAPAATAQPPAPATDNTPAPAKKCKKKKGKKAAVAKKCKKKK